VRSPYEIWRDRARRFLAANLRPEDAPWSAPLLPEDQTKTSAAAMPRVPASLVRLLERAACHRDRDNDALLYRLLWRVVHEGRGLLEDTADDDVIRVTRLVKAVDRASHKMTAFVRFRELRTAEGPRYVARFEPEHDVLMRTAPFFVERFAAMEWAIVTPDGVACWDRKALAFLDADPALSIPQDDAAEALWLTYYQSIFNPARLNVPMMRREMPVAYWKHLPEAARIPALVAEAMPRAGAMIERGGSCAQGNIVAEVPVPSVPSSLDACRRCSLWERATQAVAGVGPAHAKLMLVGEQPGDEEDLAGRPFVGPAGRLLRRALDDAGVDANAVYITNAVKHFSFEPRGKRRIHKTPAQREIEACRIWLDDEIDRVRPEIIVALGASALSALMQRRIAVGAARDAELVHRSGVRVVATYHPSAVLRAPDAQAQAAMFEALVYDVRNARALAGMVSAVMPVEQRECSGNGVATT
jgi:uracil-DNA glycosylase